MIFFLFLTNFFILFHFKINKKIDYLFIIHPLMFICIYLFTEIFTQVKILYCTFKEERKIIKEIPNLIDFLKSYLLAGLILPAAINAVLKQKKWCQPIQNSLTHISNHYAQGKSLRESLSTAILVSKSKSSRQYLCLLYLSLRLACATGENTNQILEKVKLKTQDRLNLERKLKLTTAQMRLQSLIIILSPLFLGIIIFFISPPYILFFFHELIGRILLIIMIFLNIVGAYFLNHILRIK